MKNHEYYMKKTIELAKCGWGKTSPNPLVGAIIVKDDRIISRGYHKGFGLAHAEAVAIMNSRETVEGGTLYVNLEPCSHFGKTPPCAKSIIEAGIKNVIVAMVDPNPLIQGRGIAMMREAGLNVTLGVLENEARKLNDIFIKYITKHTPFVIMKSAMTLDGKTASVCGDSKWISCEGSRNYVHVWRNRVSAVMVGINTVLADNPSLTTRLSEKECRHPARVVVDSKGRLPLDCKLLHCGNDAGIILATTSKIDAGKEKCLTEMGVRIIKSDDGDGRVNLNILMDQLYRLGMDSVLLEGGGTLNASALEAGIVDKVIMFIAPKIIGGKQALTPVEGEGIKYLKDAVELHDITVDRIENDIIFEGYI